MGHASINSGSSASLPFALPDLGQEEIEAVGKAMSAGWVTSGPRAREFEENFSSYLGDGPEAVAVNSATAGLHLALEALGIGPGDEVLVPTWTFTASAEVVRYLGATPVLVDVDRRTLNLDLNEATKKVTSRTKAIMPVHFAGLAMNSKELLDFKKRHGVLIVDDAAHAFPSSCAEGRMVGSTGSDATVFSFYATKTLTTGEGGMLVTPHAEVAARARIMRLHGIDRDVFNRYRATRPAWRYDVVAPGYKYNMTDMAAAMGLVQLTRVEDMRARREDIARTYNRSFDSTSLELPATAMPGVHSWHLYVVRLGNGQRDAFIEEVTQAGVGTSVHFQPLHLMSYWRNASGYASADFPVASREFENVISLPIYSAMTDADVARVTAAVHEALDTLCR